MRMSVIETEHEQRALFELSRQARLVPKRRRDLPMLRSIFTLAWCFTVPFYF